MGPSFLRGPGPSSLGRSLRPSNRFLFSCSLAFLRVLPGIIGLLKAALPEPGVEVLNNCGVCKSKIPETEKYQELSWENSFHVPESVLVLGFLHE